jgi:hypothetical protein
MYLDYIKPIEGKRLKLSTLVFLADLAGCGTIRGVIPTILLNQYVSKDIQFQQFFLNFFTKDLSCYQKVSYVVFQRAATSRHVELIDIFKTKISPLSGSKLIYEIDDLLINIPSWNYASEYYVKNKSYIMEIMRKCNGIIVSSQRLKDVYIQFNPNINIVPNHLAKFYWGEPEFKLFNNKKPRILWPGSSNHFAVKGSKQIGGDFGPVLLDFIKKTTDIYEWHFMGGYPLEIEDLVKSGKIIHHMWKSVWEYPAYLKSINADVAMAPLSDGIFNECKSNIKVLEFTGAGIPCVYKNIYPYYNSFMRYDKEEELISKIEDLIKSDDLKFETWKRDHASVKDQLFWEENGNLMKYVNAHLNLIGKELVL